MYATQFAVSRDKQSLLTDKWTRQDASDLIDSSIDKSVWTRRVAALRKYRHYLQRQEFEFDFHIPSHVANLPLEFEAYHSLNYREFTYLYLLSMWVSMKAGMNQGTSPRYKSFITDLINDEWPNMRILMEASISVTSNQKYTTLEQLWSALISEWMQKKRPCKEVQQETVTI